MLQKFLSNNPAFILSAKIPIIHDGYFLWCCGSLSHFFIPYETYDWKSHPTKIPHAKIVQHRFNLNTIELNEYPEYHKYFREKNCNETNARIHHCPLGNHRYLFITTYDGNCQPTNTRDKQQGNEEAYILWESFFSHKSQPPVHSYKHDPLEFAKLHDFYKLCIFLMHGHDCPPFCVPFIVSKLMIWQLFFIRMCGQKIIIYNNSFFNASIIFCLAESIIFSIMHPTFFRQRSFEQWQQLFQCWIGRESKRL